MSPTPDRPPSWRCRWCRGDVARAAALPDGLVRCAACGLVQRRGAVPSSPVDVSAEPAALRALTRQASDAVGDLARAGLARPGATAAAFACPYGGSWSPALADAGLVVTEATDDDAAAQVDLVVDPLAMAHEPDQRAALEGRVSRLAPGGVLVLHVLAFEPAVQDVRVDAPGLGQGLFAYYTVGALVEMADDVGLQAVGVWEHDLFGGTVVVAFARSGSPVVAQHTVGVELVRRMVRRERG